jgi:ribonuclease-3
LIAALFLDAGIEPAQRFIVRSILEPELTHLQEIGAGRLPIMDYKSALQESTHTHGRPQPRYLVVREHGPEHHKIFTVEVHIGGASGAVGFVCRAEGNSKKRAEQKAAQQAFERLKSLERGSAADASSPSAESSTEA